jgi:hypothetical protein
MQFIAKKYTILMNNEPLEVWIKNNQIKQSKFMERKVALDLNVETIKQIQDHPSKVVNGANFSENINFTENVSRMMSQQLELAIAKNDKKVMSRFARSELIPKDMENDFAKAINRPNGLRGLLVKAVNKTNSIFQNLAKKIDRYFDKVKDKVANQKVDKYLEEYQLKEFNKAPPVKDLDFSKNLDPKLMDMAEEFYSNAENSFEFLRRTDIDEQKKLANDFMKQAAKHGFTANDSHLAFFKVIDTHDKEIKQDVANSLLENKDKMIKNLESKLEKFEKKAAAKNETLEDFKTLSKGINPIDSIDLLIKNQEYLKLDMKEQQDFENKYLFTKEPPLERAKEAQEISKVIEKKPELRTVFTRDATVDFSSKTTKEEITQTWSKLQKINREQQAQNRDFMNISAVRFGGVSKRSLDKWQQQATERGIDEKITQKFVDATLRNAKELEKAGIFVEKEHAAGEYKFKDTFAKQTLFQNLDKPVAELEALNKGVQVQIESHPIKELTERVADISSSKSFENLKNEKGEVEPDKLFEYAQKLEKLALTLKETANNKSVTQSDLQMAENGVKQQQSQQTQQERA